MHPAVVKLESDLAYTLSMVQDCMTLLTKVDTKPSEISQLCHFFRFATGRLRPLIESGVLDSLAEELFETTLRVNDKVSEALEAAQVIFPDYFDIILTSKMKQYQLWLSDGYIDDSSIHRVDVTNSTEGTTAHETHKRKRSSSEVSGDGDTDGGSSGGYVYRLRLECTIGSSDKFYELALEGAEVRIRYGRRGSQGVLSVKSFGSVSQARDFMETTAEAKRRKGYVDAIDSDVGSASSPPGRVVGVYSSSSSAAPAMSSLVQHVAPVPIATTPTSSIAPTIIPSPSASGDSSVIYLVCTERGSDKFYEIRQNGTRVKLSYGRRGSQGVSSVKQFGSIADAKKFMDTTAQSKRRKGYSDSTPTDDDDEGRDTHATSVPSKLVASPAGNIGSAASSSSSSSSSANQTSGTEVDDGATDLERLERGERVFVKGSSALPYTLKKFNGGYSCTCMGWKFHIKNRGIQCCTCKHLRELRGDAAEDARCSVGGPPAASGSAAGSGSSTSRRVGTSSASNGAKNLAITKKISLAQKWTGGSVDLKLYAMSEVRLCDMQANFMILFYCL